MTQAVHGLEQSQPSPHTSGTSGQSRWGGVETSNHRRRSSSLGRVAVTMSKALPKGGSALCLCRVSNTRLRPVPPSHGEARLQLGTRQSYLAAQRGQSRQAKSRGDA